MTVTATHVQRGNTPLHMCCGNGHVGESGGTCTCTSVSTRVRILALSLRLDIIAPSLCLDIIAPSLCLYIIAPIDHPLSADCAAVLTQSDVLKLLLPNVAHSLLRQTNDAGSPPIHWAVLNNHTEIVRTLAELPEEQGGGLGLLKVGWRFAGSYSPAAPFRCGVPGTSGALLLCCVVALLLCCVVALLLCCSVALLLCCVVLLCRSVALSLLCFVAFLLLCCCALCPVLCCSLAPLLPCSLAPSLPCSLAPLLPNLRSLAPSLLRCLTTPVSLRSHL
jgi:ankyrin repeat protein